MVQVQKLKIEATRDRKAHIEAKIEICDCVMYIGYIWYATCTNKTNH